MTRGSCALHWLCDASGCVEGGEGYSNAVRCTSRCDGSQKIEKTKLVLTVTSVQFFCFVVFCLFLSSHFVTSCKPSLLRLFYRKNKQNICCSMFLSRFFAAKRVITRSRAAAHASIPASPHASSSLFLLLLSPTPTAPNSPPHRQHVIGGGCKIRRLLLQPAAGGGGWGSHSLDAALLDSFWSIAT